MEELRPAGVLCIGNHTFDAAQTDCNAIADACGKSRLIKSNITRQTGAEGAEDGIIVEYSEAPFVN